MFIKDRGIFSKSLISAPIKPEERRNRLLSMLKELVKGYYLILLVATFCIILLVVIMLLS